jgi:Fe/S biogenesis protein NfuA
MTDEGVVASEPILRLDDEVRRTVVALRADEPNAENLALWVEVTGANGDTYTYDVWFQVVADAARADAVQVHDDLSVVIPSNSIDRLRGSTLELDADGAMLIKNPNRPPVQTAPGSPSMGMAPADLSGDVAQRVIQVLEEQINPAIAAHGGHAELVAVQEDVAYLRLSGGCAGCGMAAVTLSQGIEVAIRDSVPEITRVADVTDHAAGTNPYYEPAKK